MRIISFIDQPDVIKKILQHLALWKEFRASSEYLLDFVQQLVGKFFNRDLKDSNCLALSRPMVSKTLR